MRDEERLIEDDSDARFLSTQIAAKITGPDGDTIKEEEEDVVVQVVSDLSVIDVEKFDEDEIEKMRNNNNQMSARSQIDVYEEIALDADGNELQRIKYITHVVPAAFGRKAKTPREAQKKLSQEGEIQIAMKQIESIRKAIAQNGIGEKIGTTRLGAQKKRSFGRLSDVSFLGEQQSADPLVEKARQSLLIRFTARQLREFICIKQGVPRPYMPNTSTPVRRAQRERREMRAAPRLVKSQPGFKLNFPFVTIQVGDFQSYLPLDYQTHPQQKGRPNSLTLNGESKRMVYEFTLFDKNRNRCYAVWSTALSNIAAIHVSDHLIYLRLNVAPLQVVSFIGEKSNPKSDITNGQRERSPLHYFRLREPGQTFFEGLMRCDPSHFAAILMGYDEFFARAAEAMGVSPPSSDQMMQETWEVRNKSPMPPLKKVKRSLSDICIDEVPQSGKMFAPTESPSFAELLRFSAFNRSLENARPKDVDMDISSMTHKADTFDSCVAAIRRDKKFATTETIEIVGEDHVVIETEINDIADASAGDA
ncbi:unnamed protein product, partial [Mesorhabditis belari]|uniref:Uncharacterized protein n=1 Tax=Mesorhabditis belari TaxID=2138241 RepID=A0AAF3F6H1_9BILA